MKRSRSWSDWSLDDHEPSLKRPWRRQFGPEKYNSLSRRCLGEEETAVRVLSTDNGDCDTKIIAESIDSLGDNEHYSPLGGRGTTNVEKSSREDHLAIEDKGKESCNGTMEERNLRIVNPGSELKDSLRSGRESSSGEKNQVLEEMHETSISSVVKEEVEAAISQELSITEAFNEKNASNLLNASKKYKEENEMKLPSSSNIGDLKNADASKTSENCESQDYDFQSSGKEMSLEKAEDTLDLGLDSEKRKFIDLEENSTEAEGLSLEMEQIPVILFGPCKDDGERMIVSGEKTGEMVKRKIKGKRKSSEISLSDEAESIDEDDARDGHSIIRNFELVFRSNISKSDKILERERPKSGPLDLALGPPCVSSCDPEPETASFCSDSAPLKASVSLCSLETLSHVASCSLTHISMEGNEHSIASHPKFHGNNQEVRNEILKGDTSNGSKYKGISASRSRSSLANGKLDRFRSKTSFFRDGQEGTEKACISGTEKVLNKIVFEPLSIACRMIQEMSHQSVTYLRESIGQMVINRSKHSFIALLQDALKKRSDLTPDSLSKCHRVVLEILVTLKTGLPDFLLRADNIHSSDLAEIFLNLKCRNIACLSALPVDACDCMMCMSQNGFCSACMCLVCSSFDSACNTCAWVGCDVCLHWCHADCALKASHIRNGLSVSEVLKNPEMQFHCLACGHHSEMFGFVKEVFQACSKDWSPDVLVKELGYVVKIFSSSEDLRGKQLYDVANHLLEEVRNRALHSEVLDHILSFLSGSGSKFLGKSNEIVKEEHVIEGENGILPAAKHSRSSVNDLRIKVLGKEPVIDELDDVVRLKEIEAEMYLKHSDDARREAERLKQICEAKSEMIEEDYLSGLLRLQIPEIERRCKLKLEQLHALQEEHSEYVNMKERMEVDVKNLMAQMEASIQKFNL